MVRIISALILAVTVACAVAAEPLQLVDNPPDRHIVVRGDTLWAISGKFLKQPWRWPEIWQLNKAEIKNPHLIYPGDIVLLDRSGANPRLRIAKPVGSRGPVQDGKLKPKIYSDPIGDAIPSIPPNEIEPFLSKPLVIEPGEHDNLPRIVAPQEDRMFMGAGDTAFVSNIPDASVVNWQVFRPGKPLIDPDTQEVLGHEAYFLGNAKLVQPGAPAVIRLTVSKEEIGRGDQLVPAPPANLIAYAPHRPEASINGKILNIYGGLREAGAGSVITLNRGEREGLEVGHVLALFRKRTAIVYDEGNRRVEVPVPEERYALAFVFRVFDRVAYALVVESSKSVIVGDSARNP